MLVHRWALTLSVETRPSIAILFYFQSKTSMPDGPFGATAARPPVGCPPPVSVDIFLDGDDPVVLPLVGVLDSPPLAKSCLMMILLSSANFFIMSFRERPCNALAACNFAATPSTRVSYCSRSGLVLKKSLRNDVACRS